MSARRSPLRRPDLGVPPGRAPARLERARKELAFALALRSGDPWADVDLASYRKAVRRTRARRPAGTGFGYSSLGFGLLGDALVARADAPRARVSRRIAIGLGWLILRRRGKPEVIWHNGGTWGFRGFAAMVPARGLAVVVLANTARSVDRVGFELVDRL